MHRMTVMSNTSHEHSVNCAAAGEVAGKISDFVQPRMAVWRLAAASKHADSWT
jgi:ABC-type phosphate transport system substrate-binding protein